MANMLFWRNLSHYSVIFKTSKNLFKVAVQIVALTNAGVKKKNIRNSYLYVIEIASIIPHLDMLQIDKSTTANNISTIFSLGGHWSRELYTIL